GLPGPTSFNAATASRPWRTSSILTQVHQPPQLQCGHGLSTVENVTYCRSRRRAHVLQCGHGLSTVENPIAIKGARTNGRLQCGHGLSTVENAGAGLLMLGVLLGFNAATASRPWRTAPAAGPAAAAAP